MVVVNHAFERKFFPSGRAVGGTVTDNTGKPKTIVGVVGDAAYSSLREQVQPAMAKVA